MSKNKQSFRFSYYLVSVNLLAFVYVAGYALFESNSSISRISILTALLMMVLLLARLIITGHLAIPGSSVFLLLLHCSQVYPYSGQLISR